jgi:hypothetical protein
MSTPNDIPPTRVAMASVTMTAIWGNEDVGSCSVLLLVLYGLTDLTAGKRGSITLRFYLLRLSHGRSRAFFMPLRRICRFHLRDRKFSPTHPGRTG